MPIRVPDELPAVNFLREENVFVMTNFLVIFSYLDV